MTRLRAWKMAGVVFMLWAAMAIAGQAQTFNTLFNFDGTTNGDDPYLMSLVQGVDGKSHQEASLLPCTASTVPRGARAAL